MSNSTDLKIAPHEGRELEYVANGIKPLALLNRSKQPEQYGRAMDLQHVLVLRRQGEDEITITTKENVHLHDLYTLLCSPKAAIVVRSAKEKHRMLGRLFGYSEEQIDAFIKADMKCACGQCNWDEPVTIKETEVAMNFVEGRSGDQLNKAANVVQDEILERLRDNESFT